MLTWWKWNKVLQCRSQTRSYDLRTVKQVKRESTKLKQKGCCNKLFFPILIRKGQSCDIKVVPWVLKNIKVFYFVSTVVHLCEIRGTGFFVCFSRLYFVWNRCVEIALVLLMHVWSGVCWMGGFVNLFDAYVISVLQSWFVPKASSTLSSLCLLCDWQKCVLKLDLHPL